MDIIMDFIRTILGQNEDNTETEAESIETSLTIDDKESTIEREIIKCQMKHGRLLPSTSKALRKKYGTLGLFGYLRCPEVDRTIQRLAKRRYRGHCSVKAEQEQLTKTLKPVIDHFFKKKKDEFDNMAL